MKLDQTQIANEMRRTARVFRDVGQDEIADGNEQIAEYIEGLECGLAAERKLSILRTGERNAARERIAELEKERDHWKEKFLEACRAAEERAKGLTDEDLETLAKHVCDDWRWPLVLPVCEELQKARKTLRGIKIRGKRP